MPDYHHGSGGDKTKKADPATGSAVNTQANNTPTPSPTKPKSQRLRRGLRALVNHPNGVYRDDMDIAVGAQNSPEYVSRLRMAGWDIATDRVPMIDRDGRTVRVGRYRLAPDQRDAAVAALGL